MIEAHYWPTNDPGKQGALVSVLTRTGTEAKIRFYDGTERWVPLSELEAKVT